MKTALIIENDPVVRLVLLRTLGRHGWTVDVVDDVDHAIVFLNRTQPNVILIDWHAGECSDLFLLMLIKLHPVWHRMPVVMMREGATLEEVERAYDMGANDFLPKPFTGEAALRTLDRWVFDEAGRTEREMAG